MTRLRSGAVLFALLGGAAACDATGPEPSEPGPVVVWPISGSVTPDAAQIVFPYGPRDIGRYDFHAGIDIYVPRGTPARAIMAGTVEIVSPSTVMVRHGGGRRSAYLHLDSVTATPGERVTPGDVVGLVGDVNARDVHLHLTWMEGSRTSIDERESRNPLVILPPVAPRAPTGRIEGDSVVVTFYSGFMTAQTVEVRFDAGPTSLLDYGAIVAQGATPRDNQIQAGLHIHAGRTRPAPGEGREFDLVLRSAEPGRRIDEVILKDFLGAELLRLAR